MTTITELVKCWGKDVNPDVPDKTIKDVLDFVLTESDYQVWTLICTGPDKAPRRIRLVPRDVSDGSILVRILGKDFHPSIHRQTLTCLADLSSSYVNQIKIASFPGVVDAVINLLGRAGGEIVHEQAARCLANLAQSRENHEKIASVNVIDSLLKLLERDGSAGGRFQSVRCLTNVAESYGMRIAYFPGALDALIGCAGSWGSSGLHRKVQKQATKCLISLASMAEIRFQIILYPRALETMVQLLGTRGTYKVQLQAAKLLTLLSDDSQSSRVVIASYRGVLDSLFRILGHNWITKGRISVQSEAARCLFKLTLADENLKRICFHSGALDSIVKCVDPNNYRIQKVQSLTAGCLSKLAGSSENRAEMLSFPGTIPSLGRLLVDPRNPSGRELAAWCLSKLSEAQETKVQIASDQSVLDALSQLLKRQHLDSLHEPLVKTIASLALEKENRVRIASHVGVLDALVSLLKSNQVPIVLEQTSKCVSYLADERENISKICSYPDVLDTLVTWLNRDVCMEDKMSVLENLALSIAYLANSPETQVMIASTPGMLQALISLLTPSSAYQGEAGIQDQIILCLTRLSESSENLKKIASCPGAYYALRRLSNGDEDSHLQEQAALCLGILRSTALADQQARRTSGDETKSVQTMMMTHRDSLYDPYYWCVDPHTCETMCDPVKGNDGITYDRWTLISSSISSLYDPSISSVTILCDDVDVRRRLFQTFPEQEPKCHRLRKEYREQALQQVLAGELQNSVAKLRNVLNWAPSDSECTNALDRVVTSLPEKSLPRNGPLHERHLRRTLGSLVTPTTPAARETVVGLATRAMGELIRAAQISRIPTILHEELMQIKEKRAHTVLVFGFLYGALILLLGYRYRYHLPSFQPFPLQTSS